MLVKVCQIRDAVQKLKEYGHMKYLAWQMILACSDFVNDLTCLDDLIEQLEQQLSSWISYVWRCRYHYSELNFYKASQLIVLREELTKVHNFDDHQISLQVFQLLNSVIGKPLESELIVKKALKVEVYLDQDIKKEEHTGEVPALDQPIEKEEELELEAISKVNQALAYIRCDVSKSAIYDESTKLGYEDYLILQALIHEDITDIFEMMDWYNELTEEDIDKYQKDWMINDDSKAKQNLLSTNKSQSDLSANSTDYSAEYFDDIIDISHVASYFFKGVERSSFEK